MLSSFFFLDHVVESNFNFSVPGNCHLCSAIDDLEVSLAFSGHNNQIIRSLPYISAASFFLHCRDDYKISKFFFPFPEEFTYPLVFPCISNIPKKEWCSFFTSKSIHQGCFQNEAIYFNMDYAATIVCFKKSYTCKYIDYKYKNSSSILKISPQVTNISI